METDKKLVAYEQAIKAYQFQVARYNTWMNYYAIFVGALFVALYSIACGTGGCCKCCACGTVAELLLSRKGMLVLVALLGIVASICWMGSLIGNCAWMNNYIRRVKETEELFFGPAHRADSPYLNVYRYISADPEEMRPGYVSTQKMTKWFVGTVLMAWIFIFIHLVWGLIGVCACEPAGLAIDILLSFGIASCIYYILQHCTCSAFSCDLRGMIR